MLARRTFNIETKKKMCDGSQTGHTREEIKPKRKHLQGEMEMMANGDDIEMTSKAQILLCVLNRFPRTQYVFMCVRTRPSS